MTKDTRPLFRYTVGDCSDGGVECLELSISYLRRLFGKCDVCVCFNDDKHADRLCSLGVPLVDQRKHEVSLPVPPSGVAWKLYPPRLRPHGHEIFIDNDVLLYAAPPQLDEFLKGDLWLGTEGVKRCFGRYDRLCQPGLRVNTGIVGVPPGVDFGGLLEGRIDGGWQEYYDEQGLVASLILDHDHRIVPIDVLAVSLGTLPYRAGTHGTHFAGLNGGDRTSWDKFLLGQSL